MIRTYESDLNLFGKHLASIWRPFTLVVTPFILSRLILWVAQAVWGASQADPVSAFFASPCVWDCEWYLKISSLGYDRVPRWPDGSADWAFFPAFPVVVFIAKTALFASPQVAAAIVSLCLFAGSLVLFSVYAADLFGGRIAGRAGVFLAFWPFSVHLSVPMSESLYFPVSLSVFILARREKWIAAGLCAALLSGTRPLGLFVTLPFFLIVLQRHKFIDLLTMRAGTERCLIGLGLCGMGLAAYALFLHSYIGDALAFSHIQVTWDRQFKWPWVMLFDELNPFTVSPEYHLYNLFNTAFIVMGFLAIGFLFRRRLFPEASFLAATLLVAMIAGQTTSIPRYLGATFPFAVAAMLLLENDRWGFVPKLIFPIFFSIFCYLWVTESLYVM